MLQATRVSQGHSHVKVSSIVTRVANWDQSMHVWYAVSNKKSDWLHVLSLRDG